MPTANTKWVEGMSKKKLMQKTTTAAAVLYFETVNCV
jgi:hypothetical protein